MPQETRELTIRMARENPTWGQLRVAAELSLKLGIFLSPRTVRKYWPWESKDRARRGVSSQRWATFVRNHADAIVACDFMVAVTAGFHNTAESNQITLLSLCRKPEPYFPIPDRNPRRAPGAFSVHR